MLNIVVLENLTIYSCLLQLVRCMLDVHFVEDTKMDNSFGLIPMKSWLSERTLCNRTSSYGLRDAIAYHRGSRMMKDE